MSGQMSTGHISTGHISTDSSLRCREGVRDIEVISANSVLIWAVLIWPVLKCSGAIQNTSTQSHPGSGIHNTSTQYHPGSGIQNCANGGIDEITSLVHQTDCAQVHNLLDYVADY